MIRYYWVNINSAKASKDYSQHLRRIKFYDAEHKKYLLFLTHNFDLSALTIAQLCRWHVELFLKWIKQRLRIREFYGITENAVKTQIWIAISVYVPVAIVKNASKQMLHFTQFYRFLA